jgi:periplasmic divalent cation tolerance protein
MKTPAALLVVTTVPDRRTARTLAGVVLEAQAAACASISGPVRSHYTWKGRRESATEFVITFKLPARGYARLEALLRAHHPYECPEILALPATAGAPAYLEWLEQSVPPGGARSRNKASRRSSQRKIS